MKITFLSIILSLVLCHACFAQYHTISITDSIEQNGWNTHITKTYYRDDTINWVSNIFNARSSSSEESTVSTVIELNCVNLGNDVDQIEQPVLSFKIKGYQIDDNMIERKLKLKIGNSQLSTKFNIKHDKLGLSNAADIIMIMSQNQSSKMTIYFDIDHFSTFDLSGIKQLLPDLIECTKSK